MGSPGSILRAPGSVTSLTQCPSGGQACRDRRKGWLHSWPESEGYHGAGEKGDSSLCTHQSNPQCVLCPGPKMALSLSPSCSPVSGGRPGFHAKLNIVQGSESNKRGGGVCLFLGRSSGALSYTLLLCHTQAHHIHLPSTSGSVPFLPSSTVLTLTQTFSYHFYLTAIVSYLVFPSSVSPL